MLGTVVAAPPSGLVFLARTPAVDSARMRVADYVLAALAVQLVCAIVLLALLRGRKKRGVQVLARGARVVPCDHVSPPASPRGCDDEQWWQSCPGCSETFQSYKGYSTHMGKNKSCASLQERKKQEEGPSPAQMHARAGMYKSGMSRQVNWDLSELRIGRLIGGAHTDHIKVQTRLCLDKIEEELVQRLEGRDRTTTGKQDLREVVHDVLDIFDGQETEAQEMRFLRGYVRTMDVKERRLGTRESHTTDAEGFRVGRAWASTSDVVYDIPLDAHIERLIQNDTQAWKMILATQEEWAESDVRQVALPPRSSMSISLTVTSFASTRLLAETVSSTNRAHLSSWGAACHTTTSRSTMP